MTTRDDAERTAARWKRLEAAMLAGASWPVALEAASTVAIDRDARDQTYTLDDLRAETARHRVELYRQGMPSTFGWQCLDCDEDQGRMASAKDARASAATHGDVAEEAPCG